MSLGPLSLCESKLRVTKKHLNLAFFKRRFFVLYILEHMLYKNFSVLRKTIFLKMILSSIKISEFLGYSWVFKEEQHRHFQAIKNLRLFYVLVQSTFTTSKMELNYYPPRTQDVRRL